MSCSKCSRVLPRTHFTRRYHRYAQRDDRSLRLRKLENRVFVTYRTCNICAANLNFRNSRKGKDHLARAIVLAVAELCAPGTNDVRPADVMRTMAQQDHRCALCAMPLSPQSLSLDKKESQGILMCCRACRQLRDDYEREEFQVLRILSNSEIQ